MQRFVHSCSIISIQCRFGHETKSFKESFRYITTSSPFKREFETKLDLWTYLCWTDSLTFGKPKQRTQISINSPKCWISTFSGHIITFITQHTRSHARNQGGYLGRFSSPENFKTLHSNFDICRNIQKIKMKSYILIIFKRSPI